MSEEAIIKWMKLAFVEANEAYKVNEVPVGAVFVKHERLPLPTVPCSDRTECNTMDCKTVYNFPDEFEDLRRSKWSHIDFEKVPASICNQK